MRLIKWRILAVTCFVCLLPIILGVVVWERLPDIMAIHFDINNNPNGFASKTFVVFALPAIMGALQALCCIITDFNAYKRGECKNPERATKWILPVMSIILQIATLAYGMGQFKDMRRIAILIVGVVMIITGKCMTKSDYIKNYNIDAKKARKINRFVGYETVIMGVLALLTVLLPPVASFVWIILIIPYTAISIIYAIRA